MAIHLESTASPSRHSLSLGNLVRRDLEVGRFDHVQSGATWLTDIAAEAAAIAGVPFAAVNLMRSSTQRTVAAVGLDVNVVARRHSMCDAIIEEGTLVHIPDASQDDRWSSNPFVDGTWGSIRFYAAHPLVTPSGFAVGTLCVLDNRPRELEAWQVQKLDLLASSAVSLLERSRLDLLKKGLRDVMKTVAQGSERSTLHP